MSNNRIYYPIQQVLIKGDTDGTYNPVHGLQSVSTTTNFNLVQAYEIGQISIYDNIEDIPDIQVTLNKVLDGYLPIYCLATTDATTPTLVDRANQKCFINLGIFDESSTSAVGTPIGQMEASGLYVNSVRYNFPKDGNFNEEVTLVGNSKVWKGDSKLVDASAAAWAVSLSTSGYFAGSDVPLATAGIDRRENLLLTTSSGSTDVNGAVLDPACTILPPDVAGVGSNGVNNLTITSRAHLNNISVSVNLNRESITELGRKGPYFRNPTFPVEVSTEIEITATSGDLISATENGIISSASGNLRDRTIRVATTEGTKIYCGLKNKLQSVNYGGGDAGGGTVNVSYSFVTFNDFTVIHSQEEHSVGYLIN
jgi:hypothetical protein